MRCLALLMPLSIVLTIAAPAGACGLTPPIGPNGLPAVCHGDNALRVRASLTAGGTATTIRFGDTTADLLQGATAATFDVFPLERLGLSAALGAALGGHIDYLGTRYNLDPGAIAGLGASYRFLGRDGGSAVRSHFADFLARTGQDAGPQRCGGDIHIA